MGPPHLTTPKKTRLIGAYNDRERKGEFYFKTNLFKDNGISYATGWRTETMAGPFIPFILKEGGGKESFLLKTSLSLRNFSKMRALIQELSHRKVFL